MAEIMISNIDTERERRPFADHGHAVLANAGGAAVLRGSFEPGWRWSNDVAPLAGTTSCQIHHLGYVQSGSMRVRLDDGTERDISAGDLFDLPEGHDAWVTSDVPCEMVDFASEATRYAVGRPKDIAAPEDAAMKLVRRGYEAFNAHDVQGLRSLFAHDVAQHVMAVHQMSSVRYGVKHVSRASIVFTFLGDKVTDLLEMHGDLPGDDAYLS